MFNLAQVNDRVEVHRGWFKDFKFFLIKDIVQLKKLVNICIERGIASLDLETTGVDNRVYKDEYFEDGLITRHGKRTIDKVVGICISFDGVNGYYAPLNHVVEDSGNLPWDETWDEIERLCTSARIIFHNAKFDAEFLHPLVGIDMWDINKYEDTMLIARVISPNKALFPAGLKQLTKKIFNIDMLELDDLFTVENRDFLKRTKQGYNFSLLHPREGLEYGCSDGIFTYKLYFALIERLKGCDNDIYKLEKSFCNVVRKMERNRVRVDVDRVNQLLVECKNAMGEVGDIIRKIIDDNSGKTGKWRTLNIGSPKQLSAALITDQEGIKLKPTAEMMGDENSGFALANEGDDDDDAVVGNDKQFSLKDEVLKSFNELYGKRLTVDYHGKSITLFDLILEYRHYDKMKGSYIEKLSESHDKYGDVRPSFNQLGTDTARLSCKAGKIRDGYSGINFQGIPRDSDSDKPELFKQIRTVIIPRPGKFLVKIDYAGEELRVVTNMSGDKVWTNSFLNEDGDVHSITAKSLFQKTVISKHERGKGKASNFALIYGGGAGAIQRNIGCSMEDAQRSLSNMRKDLPELMGYVEHQKRYAKKHKCVYTAFGRRMPIPTIDSPIRAIAKKAERCAINYTIQATSADVLKLAMCYTDKMIRKHGWEDVCLYVLTVHDEIVFEVEPAYLMEIIPKLDEWMTMPWKLKKAHGRDWVVPLETEPGVDIHWRARFDFFAMTRGIKPQPKDIDGNGNYIGNLKKGEFFQDGKVYQEIPDFLKDYVRMDNLSLPQASEVPEIPRKEEIQELLGKSEPPQLPPSNKTEKKEFMDEDDGGFSLGEETIDDVPPSSEKSDKVSPMLPPPPSTPSPTQAKTQEVTKPEIKKEMTVNNGHVLRWVFKAPLSHSSMKKMHAVIILAEGDTQLRVVNNQDKVMISEDEGLKVNPDQFQFLANLFGLG